LLRLSVCQELVGDPERKQEGKEPLGLGRIVLVEEEPSPAILFVSFLALVILGRSRLFLLRDALLLFLGGLLL